MKLTILDEKESIFNYVARKDLLLYYPYHSFEHFIHFLYEAVHNPETVSYTHLGTDTPEVIESRIAKAEYELSFAPQFDCIIMNDNLETAKAETLKVIKEFLEK